MNPLSVLTGMMVMRRCTEMQKRDKSFWLDEERRYEVLVNDQGGPTELTIDGRVHALGTRGRR